MKNPWKNHLEARLERSAWTSLDSRKILNDLFQGDFRIQHLFMEKLRILQFFCHPRWSKTYSSLRVAACNHPSRELFELLKLFLAWVKIGVLKSG